MGFIILFILSEYGIGYYHDRPLTAFIITLPMFFIFLSGKAGAITFVASIKKFLNLIKEIFMAADKKIEIKKEIESEEQAYQRAAEEIENNTYRKGIWAKAFAEAEGIEHRQKALYIKYRAKQLVEGDK